MEERCPTHGGAGRGPLRLPNLTQLSPIQLLRNRNPPTSIKLKGRPGPACLPAGRIEPRNSGLENRE